MDIVDAVVRASHAHVPTGFAGRGCAVAVDASVVCWSGQDGSFGPGTGQTEDVYYRHGQNLAPEGEFVDVSVSLTVSCGLRADRSALCWGDGSLGHLDAPAGPFVEVFAGDPFDFVPSCGLRADGGYVCWGRSTVSQPPGGEFVDVSSAGPDACAVSAAGAVACWGARRADPPSGSDFVEVTVDVAGACAERASGAVVCWGNMPSLEDPEEFSSKEAAWMARHDVAEGSFASVATGGANSVCGLRHDSTLECWHDPGMRCVRHHFGWLCRRASSEEPEIESLDAPAGLFSQVSAHGGTFCGVRLDATVLCWGHTLQRGTSSRAGSRGTSSRAGSLSGDFSALQPTPAGHFTQVSAGVEASCGLRADGAAVCWGHQSTEAPPGRFIDVSGGSRPCAIREDRTLRCWGHPEGGLPPDSIDQPLVSTAKGWHTACGILADATMACWNRWGGPLDAPEGTFTQISTSEILGTRVPDTRLQGYDDYCARRQDHSIVCFNAWNPADRGPNRYEQPPTGQFTHVAAGAHHACAIRPDGTVACWGKNSDKLVLIDKPVLILGRWPHRAPADPWYTPRLPPGPEQMALFSVAALALAWVLLKIWSRPSPNPPPHARRDGPVGSFLDGRGPAPPQARRDSAPMSVEPQHQPREGAGHG